MGPSACGCTRMVAELLLGHQRDSLHAPQEHLWRSGRLRWAMWSTLGKKMGQWRRLIIRTPYTHRGGGGVLHREACRSASSKAFFVRFFVAYPPQ